MAQPLKIHINSRFWSQNFCSNMWNGKTHHTLIPDIKYILTHPTPHKDHFSHIKMVKQ